LGCGGDDIGWVGLAAGGCALFARVASWLKGGNMSEDDIIIKDYREAFRKYAKDNIIDLDHRLKHKFNFQIHRLEDLLPEWQGVIPPVRQSQFFINLCIRGTGEKTVGRFVFPVHKNTMIIIPSRVTHSSRYWSSDVSGYWLSFNLDFFLQNEFPKNHIVDKKIFKRSIKPYLILTGEQVQMVQVIYENLIVEYKGDQKRKLEMIAIKVLELAVICDRFFTEAEMLQHDYIYNSVIERFTELIQKSYTKERSVQYYANALHMHPNHLNMLSKKYTGLTAKETITDFIITEAKCLLHSTSLTVKEIAYELGFNDPEQFSTFFRKQLKISPRQYKVRPV
jgi:AraC family transcriptional activator of pobA